MEDPFSYFQIGNFPAIWQGWEEPMPRVPSDLVEGLPEQKAFRQKRQEDREGKQQNPGASKGGDITHSALRTMVWPSLGARTRRG
jgi:hypothetical protein